MLRTAVGVTLASINQPFSNPKMDAVLADEKLAVLAKLDVRENTSKILNFVKEKSPTKSQQQLPAKTN